jgi:hypothetical protein
VSRKVERPPHFVFVVAFALLVVIPEGDLLLLLPLSVFDVTLQASEEPTVALATYSTQENIVISTEAVHSLIVNRAVERTPHFVFVIAFVLLAVIPEGDLLFALAVAVACFDVTPPEQIKSSVKPLRC